MTTTWTVVTSQENVKNPHDCNGRTHFVPKMDPNAVQGWRALLAMLNQQNVSREVNQLFTASTPLTASGNMSAAMLTPSVTTTAATLQTPPGIRNIRPLFTARGGASRGRGRNRSHLYTSIGVQFTRVVILLGDQTDDVRATWKGQGCDLQHAAWGSCHIQDHDDVPRRQNNHPVHVSSQYNTILFH